MTKGKSLTDIYKASFLIIIFLVYTIFLPSAPNVAKIIIDILVLLVAIYLFKDDLKEEGGIFKKKIGFNIKWVIISFVLIFAIQIITGALLENLFNILPPSKDGQLALFRQAPVYLFFSMLIFSPIVEELTFRKSFRKLIKNKVLYVLLSSVIYGALYVIFSAGENISYLFIVSYSLIAMVYPILYLKTNNIYAPMILHVLQNIFGIIALLTVL